MKRNSGRIKKKTKKRKEDDEPLVAKSRGKINPVRIEADG